LVTLTPPATASRTDVRLFTGIGPGAYLDFSMFTFHVPMELSAPQAAMEAIAKTTRAWLRIRRI
jgi:hypothetical protein